ncbi:MAG: hypothetical protein WCK93_09305 [Nitrosomonadales bacterium]
MDTTNFKLDDYDAIREMLTGLHHKILELRKHDDIATCARHLGLWYKKELYFNNEYESSVLADYLVYSYRPHGFNLAELYFRLNRAALDDRQADLLTRMSAVHYAILQVDVVEGQGVLRVRDAFSGESFRLVDNGLSQTLRPEQVVAAHIIDFGDFSIQTGAVLPVNYELLIEEEVRRIVTRIKVKQTENAARVAPELSAKLARAVMSAAVRLGLTDVCESLDQL